MEGAVVAVFPDGELTLFAWQGIFNPEMLTLFRAVQEPAADKTTNYTGVEFRMVGSEDAS